MVSDPEDPDEREVERLLKASAMDRERSKVVIAGAQMDRLRRKLDAQHVTVQIGDITLRYEQDRPGTGIVVIDFLGRESKLEDWYPGSTGDAGQ